MYHTGKKKESKKEILKIEKNSYKKFAAWGFEAWTSESVRAES